MQTVKSRYQVPVHFGPTTDNYKLYVVEAASLDEAIFEALMEHNAQYPKNAEAIVTHSAVRATQAPVSSPKVQAPMPVSARILPFKRRADLSAASNR